MLYFLTVDANMTCHRKLIKLKYLIRNNLVWTVVLLCTIVINIVLIRSLQEIAIANEIDKFHQAGHRPVHSEFTNNLFLDIKKAQHNETSHTENVKYSIEQYLDWIRREPTSPTILHYPSTGYHSFNTTASDLIGNLRDQISDTRPIGCHQLRYDVQTMPATSVVIVFHNEARSTLLRTIHSILLRTPERLLEEILLVDDASTMTWLLEPLDELLKSLPKTRILRLTDRQGLIRARLAGAKAAQGQVLFFLDAHSEVNTGWLEPLLHRIQQDKHVVAVPEMDIIQYQTFAYQRPAGLYHGTFTWDLQFKYMPYTRTRGNDTESIPSPVMVGCAHAVNRNYFFQTGSYDKDMDIWGGENIEHSFRIWMCGGRVEIIPCSHVGHIFKPRLPYSFKEDSRKVIQRNLIRTAEVWMDDYKDLFYATQQSITPINLKSLAQRNHLKSKMRCKDFDWYLKTVIPDMPIPPLTVKHFGHVKSQQDDSLCLSDSERSRTLTTSACSKQVLQDTFFYIDIAGRFMYKESCIHHFSEGNVTHLKIGGCGTSHIARWGINEKSQLTLRDTLARKKCLKLHNNGVLLDECTNKKTMMWSFQYTFDFTHDWDIAEIVADTLKVPPNAMLFGFVRNIETHKCLQVYGESDFEMVPCLNQADYDQIFHLDKDGRFMLGQNCLIVTDKLSLKMVNNCDVMTKQNHTHWKFELTKRQISIKVGESLLCLISTLKYARLEPCSADANQKWRFGKTVNPL